MKVDKWEYMKLLDACSIHGRIGWQGLTRAEHKQSGDYLLITGTDFTSDNKVNFDTCVYVDEFRYTQDENIQIRKNDLLITKDGTLGKLALITEDTPKPATLNGGIFVIRDKTNRIYPQFLLNYMSSDEFKKIIHNHRTGSTVPHLTQNMLVNFEIPLPPLEEQKRIVKILDEKFAMLETVKANAKTNLQNAKDLFQSQLTKAFSNTTWEKKRLDEVCAIINGYAFPSKDFSPQNTLKSVKITNVGVGNFVEDETEKLPEIYKETRSEVKVHANDLVVALTRTIISDGLKIAFVPDSFDGALVNQRVAGLIPNKKLIYPNLLFNFFKTDIAYKYVLDHVNTLMQPNLSIGDLRSFPIPLPPLPEQKRIVEQLDSLSEKVRSLEEIYTKQLANCDELKQAFLAKAFNGEL